MLLASSTWRRSSTETYRWTDADYRLARISRSHLRSRSSNWSSLSPPLGYGGLLQLQGNSALLGHEQAPLAVVCHQLPPDEPDEIRRWRFQRAAELLAVGIEHEQRAAVEEAEPEQVG